MSERHSDMAKSGRDNGLGSRDYTSPVCTTMEATQVYARPTPGVDSELI